MYRNAVVLAVPSIEGLEAARNAIRDNQGWLQIESQLKGQDIDNNRRQLLELEKKNTQARAAEHGQTSLYNCRHRLRQKRHSSFQGCLAR